MSWTIWKKTQWPYAVPISLGSWEVHLAPSHESFTRQRVDVDRKTGEAP